VTKRERFEAFKLRVAAGERVDVPELLREPDPWLRRACLTHVVRADMLDDDELRMLAREIGGKLEKFIEGMLILRRMPDDAAKREAAAYGQAWLRKRLGQ